MILAKIVASLSSVFVLSLVVQTLLGIAFAIDAAGAGSTAGADETWLADSAAVAFRVALLSTIFAGFGLALAAAGRNTAVALGAGFGYLVIVENLVRGLGPEWAPWLLTDNAAMFIIGSQVDFPLLDRTPTGAAVYLAAIALVLLLGATRPVPDAGRDVGSRRRRARVLFPPRAERGRFGGRSRYPPCQEDHLTLVDRSAYVRRSRGPYPSTISLQVWGQEPESGARGRG